MTQDQVHVPKTRSQLGLPPLDPAGEDLYGGSVTDAVKSELWDALGDSPIGASIMSMAPLVSTSAELHIAIGRTHILYLARRMATLHFHECIWPKEVPCMDKS